MVDQEILTAWAEASHDSPKTHVAEISEELS